jgi:hypothetical protein
VLVLPILVYPHWSYNLSDLGISLYGCKGDILAILLKGVLILVQVF